MEAKFGDDQPGWKATVKLGRGAGVYSDWVARLIAVKICEKPRKICQSFTLKTEVNQAAAGPLSNLDFTELFFGDKGFINS